VIDDMENSTADESDGLAADEAAPASPAESKAATKAVSSSDPAPSEAAEGRPHGEKHWYILKVQSNREDSIRDALQRRIAVAGLEDFFDEIIVPIEMVSEFKNGKKRVVKRKLYPGYIVVHMELNEDTWFLVRETPGIGDFTGSGGKPTPMSPHDVSKIVAKTEGPSDEAPPIPIPFGPGDRVKIKEGTFENFEGDVDAIDRANGRVTVMINIFGRSTPVELEYWQIEPF
jgi:transcriptional antiterminator NusG